MDFRPSRRKRPQTLLDMTPLVDVVFQLLIFFLLTSTYVQESQNNSAAVPVELPESSLAAEQAPPKALIISISQEGLLYLDGRELSFEELNSSLSKTASSAPETIVLVRGDERASYGQIARVMSLVRAFGLRLSAVLESGE